MLIVCFATNFFRSALVVASHNAGQLHVELYPDHLFGLIYNTLIHTLGSQILQYSILIFVPLALVITLGFCDKRILGIGYFDKHVSQDAHAETDGNTDIGKDDQLDRNTEWYREALMKFDDGFIVHL